MEKSLKQNYEKKIPPSKLKQSRAERSAILRHLRFVPTSLWYLQKGTRTKRLDEYIGDKLAKGSYEEHEFSVRSGALSQFPAEVARRAILYWSKEGDAVFDPFAARLARLLMANLLKRHAIGFDISKKFAEHNFKRLDSAIPNPEYKIGFHRKDSRKTNLPGDVIDFILTSPPYFDLEDYGDEPEQLGYGEDIHGEKPDYLIFLRELQKVVDECYRVLKPGKYCCWAVNDFRKDGKFFAYHADCIKLFLRAGFDLHDIVIYNLSEHPLHAIFMKQLWDRRHTAKQHEYLLVFRKPGGEISAA